MLFVLYEPFVCILESSLIMKTRWDCTVPSSGEAMPDKALPGLARLALDYLGLPRLS